MRLSQRWIRRARKDGDPWEGEVPLSEAFERYAVRVFKDGVLKREVTVATSNWTYTSAMQVADGAGETRIDVAQVSETYGEGPSRAVTFGS